jgi:iron complex outermembrane recepter protein
MIAAAGPIAPGDSPILRWGFATVLATNEGEAKLNHNNGASAAASTVWMVCTMMMGATVSAQTMGAHGNGLQDSSVSEAPTNSTAPNNTGLQEIVVTAQRRSERLQDVPISVSAFSAAQLVKQGIASSQELGEATPGLFLPTAEATVIPFIRGVGSQQITLGEGGSVGIYVDGVYYPEAFEGIYDLANIESVEVLKGPQGTLFGRNTAGGTINIHTRAPQFTEEGSVEGSYGNFNNVQFRGYETAPISQNVAFSVAANYDRSDSYIRDLYRGGNVDDTERYLVRGALLIKPMDDLRITLSGDFGHTDDPTPEAAQPLHGYLGQTATSLNPQGPDQYVGELKSSLTAVQSGASARVEYDFPFVNLVSLSAYRHFLTRTSVEISGTPIPYADVVLFRERENVFSQEIQLTSKIEGPFRWIAGAYYSNQDSADDPAELAGIAFGSSPTRIVATVRDINVAGFANGTLTFGPVEFTGGLRYNAETKRYSASLDAFPVITDEHRTFTSRTPRVVISYHASHDLLVYGSYTEGFKSGAYNALSFPSAPINPETVQAYEVGVKFGDANKFTLNSAVFLYNRRDIQVQSNDPVTGIQLLENAASGQTKGAEIDATVHPVSALSLTGGITYLDARYGRFPNALVFVPTPVPLGAIPGSLGNTPLSADLAGARIEYSPRWSGNVAASYDIALPNGGRLVPSFNVYETSFYFLGQGNRLRQPEYTLVNAELAWHLPGDRLSFSVYGKNIGDVQYLSSVVSNPFTDQVRYADPRMYGIRVRYAF